MTKFASFTHKQAIFLNLFRILRWCIQPFSVHVHEFENVHTTVFRLPAPHYTMDLELVFDKSEVNNPSALHVSRGNRGHSLMISNPTLGPCSRPVPKDIL
jgi:hypothetical protein